MAHIKQMFQRFGPVSGQIQTHREGRVAPCRRGCWAFPRVVHRPSDLYMVSHIYMREMPKRLQNWDVDVDGPWEIREAEFKAWWDKITKQKKFRWSTIILDLDTEIYTRLPPTWHPGHKDPNHSFDQEWYKCTVRENWDRIHHKSVFWTEWFGKGKLVDSLYQPCFGNSQCDVYEVFIPM